MSVFINMDGCIGLNGHVSINIDGCIGLKGHVSINMDGCIGLKGHVSIYKHGWTYQLKRSCQYLLTWMDVSA